MDKNSEQRAAGLLITGLRGKTALSRKSLADKAGLAESRLRSIEEGHDDMSLGELAALAAALGMAPEELLGLVARAVENPEERPGPTPRDIAPGN